MIISKTFQAELCCRGRFLCAKKINLLLGTLGSYFLNTELQLRVRISIFARSIRTPIKIIIKSQNTMPNFFSKISVLLTHLLFAFIFWKNYVKEKNLLNSWAFWFPSIPLKSKLTDNDPCLRTPKFSALSWGRIYSLSHVTAKED